MNKSDLSPIEEAIKDNITRHFTVDSPQFVIGVSGGVDSMSLLYALHQLNISAVVAHINYQKRGSASNKDAEFVEQMANKWGFNSQVVTVEPSEAAGQNFQQWARNVRYQVFRDLAEKQDANGIIVAHHQDDQVETILQKVFRGAGLPSWSGMEVWDGEIFRPLLNRSREQIEQYAAENDIPYRTDESNLENDFARNFLRNEWLEKLDKFFPGWKSNMLRIGKEARNYEQAISWIASQITDSGRIERKAFDELQPGIQSAVILYLLKQRQPGIEISQQSLKRVRELSNLQTGKEIELTPHFSILRDRTYYIIQESETKSFEPVTLDRNKLQTSGVTIQNVVLTLKKFRNPDFDKALYLDSDKLDWPITLRQWGSGDQIQPLGMDGHQSVADHLTNRKISAANKQQALVIESFEETICAIIFPPIKNQSSLGTISEKCKCDSETRKCLKIKYRK